MSDLQKEVARFLAHLGRCGYVREQNERFVVLRDAL
jgi:hypothetical protein